MTNIETIAVFISGVCLGAFIATLYVQNKMDKAFNVQKRFIEALDRYITVLEINIKRYEQERSKILK